MFAGWDSDTWKRARLWAERNAIPSDDTVSGDLEIRKQWFLRGGNRRGPPAPSEMIWFN